MSKKEINAISPVYRPINAGKDSVKFRGNYENYLNFAAWAKWYPDLFLDLMKPETGGITLCSDQRTFMRAIFRFYSVYGVFPRGYGKTIIEILCLILLCIMYPGLEVALTAQTKENSAKFIKDKYYEITKFYPLIDNEVKKNNNGKPNFSKSVSELMFLNGSRLDNLANDQNSKGIRKHRINIEESNLLNNEVFEDAIEPIPSVPRKTVGKTTMLDPQELSGQMHFFTTSGYRASEEFRRSNRMLKGMIEGAGEFVLGSDWHLCSWYERTKSKAEILNIKSKVSPISFSQNYLCRWVGAAEGALVDIGKLLGCRTIENPEYKGLADCEYYLGVDVARSIKTGSNVTAIVPLKVIRTAKGKIKFLQVVNIFELSNTADFTSQAIEIKKVKRNFNAQMVIVDTNGLGIGLHDALLKESFDPMTGESLGCWDTINTEAVPEIPRSEQCVFDLKVQGLNSQVIATFIDAVETQKLRLLRQKSVSEYEISDYENKQDKILPYVLTDSLIEEISNLKLKMIGNGKIGVESVIKGYSKDKYSATQYVVWYVVTYKDQLAEEEEEDINGLLECVIM